MSFGTSMKKLLKTDGIIAPRMAAFLGQHQVMEYDDWVVEIAAEILSSNANSIRHSRFGGSSRGQCERKQLLAYLGAPSATGFDDVLSNLFADGHFRHLRWQMNGLQAGLFTDVEVPFRVDDIHLGVSVDAINEDEGWIFELKGSRHLFKEPPRDHLLQIHTYFLATGYDTCVYVVEDKASQEWREWVVCKDDKIMDEVTEEIGRLNYAVRTKTLPNVQEVCSSRKSAEFKRCQFSDICFGASYESLEEVTIRG